MSDLTIAVGTSLSGMASDMTAVQPNKKEIRIPATSQEQVKANPRRNDVSTSYSKHWSIVGEFSSKDYRYAGGSSSVNS